MVIAREFSLGELPSSKDFGGIIRMPPASVLISLLNRLLGNLALTSETVSFFF
jgi:hypothetical protein